MPFQNLHNKRGVLEATHSYLEPRRLDVLKHHFGFESSTHAEVAS